MLTFLLSTKNYIVNSKRYFFWKKRTWDVIFFESITKTLKSNWKDIYSIRYFSLKKSSIFLFGLYFIHYNLKMIKFICKFFLYFYFQLKIILLISNDFFFLKKKKTSKCNFFSPPRSYQNLIKRIFITFGMFHELLTKKII